MSKKWKVGIVGARGLSTVLGFNGIPDAEVAALCDTDAALLENQSKKLNIPHTYRTIQYTRPAKPRAAPAKPIYEIDAWVQIAPPKKAPLPMPKLNMPENIDIATDELSGVVISITLLCIATL